MSLAWKQRPEGGSLWAMRALLFLVRHGGRWIGRVLLYPITVYFLMVRGEERRASRAYLGRTIGRPARIWHVAHHIHTFASTILDRIFFLSGELERFHLHVHGLHHLISALEKKQGVLIFGSHVGSFDALRALCVSRPDLKVYIVFDQAQNPRLTGLLHAINGQLADTVIDASRAKGPVAVLAIKQALDEGAFAAMLIDRSQPGHAMIPAQFLGKRAWFPSAPWLIASALGVPVILAFGLYHGGRRYEIMFEKFAEQIVLPRPQRRLGLAQIVQEYATRLESVVLRAPYNWFNFYDFWIEPDAKSDDLDGHARSVVQRRSG